jgi:hypothetical protein
MTGQELPHAGRTVVATVLAMIVAAAVVSSGSSTEVQAKEVGTGHHHERVTAGVVTVSDLDGSKTVL